MQSYRASQRGSPDSTERVTAAGDREDTCREGALKYLPSRESPTEFYRIRVLTETRSDHLFPRKERVGQVAANVYSFSPQAPPTNILYVPSVRMEHGRVLTKYQARVASTSKRVEEGAERSHGGLTRAQEYVNACNVPRSISCVNYGRGTYYCSEAKTHPAWTGAKSEAKRLTKKELLHRYR